MNYISLNIRDPRGEVLIVCPRCHHEFKASAESIQKYGVVTCPIHKDIFEFSEKCLSRQDKARAEKLQQDWIVKYLPPIKIEL